MSKSRVFFIILVAFITGVFARSFFELGNNLYFFLLIFSLIFLAVFYKNKKIIVAFSFLLFFIFGAWLTGSKIEETRNLPYAGRAIQAKAVVQKASGVTFGQNIIVRDDQKKNILVQVPKYPEHNYGDLLDINCILKPIENRDADFDYKMYMAKDGVLYQCDKEEIKLVAKNKGNFWLDKIFHVRNLLQENIRKVIPEPEGALASGILFGGSNELSKEIQNEFSQTGMTHIVAVSGYNVTIIAEYLIIIGIWIGLWRKKAVWFAIVGVVLFVIMIGLPSSAVRAGVMGTLLLWAMKNGRLANSENAIIFAAAAMLFFNPLLLRWDIGFQLSFLATLGIVFSSPIWEKSFVKKNKALGISEIIALSLSAQIFVLPIIAYNFHIVSLISLLANVLILPVVPLSMLLVFLAALSGFVFAPLSMVLAWLAFVPLTYEIKIIHTLAQFPWASIEMKKFGVWWIIIYYSILAGGICLLGKKNFKFQMTNYKSNPKSK
ncbi:MAG TPA: ComEC/Rec2 family competence protein [Candidatus Moranbacteria bacterium]|nr:ComEC/Rec2 family competence protein [Candidatus Moranbacteria bacterium]HRY28167.1 ComEC/Rec2 family competence protein [Candidatus Moranbacteria bacterium]HSA08638.1 ComEC/Rec2 family competence protein [Candidatus Moranbacteria bacterium]